MGDEVKQARVILWGVPRSISTSFLKCLTFVEDSVCWHEPYLYAQFAGTDGLCTEFIQKMMKEMMVCTIYRFGNINLSYWRGKKKDYQKCFASRAKIMTPPGEDPIVSPQCIASIWIFYIMWSCGLLMRTPNEKFNIGTTSGNYVFHL